MGKLNFRGYLISRFFSYSQNSQKFDAREKCVFYSNAKLAGNNKFLSVNNRPIFRMQKNFEMYPWSQIAVKIIVN